MSILSIYDHFSFAILPCPMTVAREALLAQSAAWDRYLVVDCSALRDVRPVLNSPDGPAQLPSVRKGILLSEVEGPEGAKTLFVSSVADGYMSMIYMISKGVPGLHLVIQASSLSCKYPRNAITAIAEEETVRVVYAMRDTNTWEFIEKGAPLFFEDSGLYGARQKRDRLTPEIISKYLARFGYGSLDKDFWISAEPAQLLCEREFRLLSEVPQ